MKKTLLVTSLFLLANTAAAEKNPMVEMSISMMKQNGELQKLAACTGKSPASVESATREVMNKCMQGADLSDDHAMTSCMEKNMLAKLGVSKAKLESCRSPEERETAAMHDQMSKLQEQMAQITNEEQAINAKDELSEKDEIRLQVLSEKFAELENQLYDLEDNVDSLSMSDTEKSMQALLEKGGELSAEDRAKLRALQEAVMQEGMDEMDQQIQMMAKASEGTLDSITLPVYSNSKVMMHVPVGMNLNGVKALPAATFSSSDSVDKILAYYQKKLPNFKMKKMSDGQVFLMETLPQNFDVLKHMKEYVTTPHITISPVKDQGMGVPSGTKSTIEIAYRAK